MVPNARTLAMTTMWWWIAKFCDILGATADDEQGREFEREREVAWRQFAISVRSGGSLWSLWKSLVVQ
ncbi:hypothetical protein E2542_SST07584 [Spatholobus suberectus]|nr:hypothetical protein E2542_SST07584 [Spatholobus suberectus]